jgi:pyruvate kinase
MRRYRKAKIVATLGPASADAATIGRMFDAGADVFRLNFSHGSHDDHRNTHRILRELEAGTGRPVAILMDLQGPKIRIGRIAGGEARIERGQTFRLDLDPTPGDATRAPLPHPEIFAALAVGVDVLIDDGRLRLKVAGLAEDHAITEVVTGGLISDRKGVNLPGAEIKVSAMTDKDRIDLAFGLDLGIDWVALSFVQRPADVLEAREIIGDRAGVCAKIEKPAALQAIDGIVALSDAVMVARGDMGVEIPPEEVPGRQKELVRACRLAGKPVIVATQMLDSMVNSPAPTRAEASDVATAIYDGADAVMLSAESAAGHYPVESVAMMDRIIRATESHSDYRAIVDALNPEVEPTIPHAIAAAAAEVADKIGAKAIVTFTSSGTTATRAARARPQEPVIAITPNIDVARRLALLWGTHNVHEPDIASMADMVSGAQRIAVRDGFAANGDRIVVTAGVPFGASGTTNILRVITVGRES